MHGLSTIHKLHQKDAEKRAAAQANVATERKTTSEVNKTTKTEAPAKPQA